MTDRLSKVQARSTYVISVWVYGQDKHKNAPADILGPYTKTQAQRIAELLTCEHRVESIRTDVPEWAIQPVALS